MGAGASTAKQVRAAVVAGQVEEVKAAMKAELERLQQKEQAAIAKGKKPRKRAPGGRDRLWRTTPFGLACEFGRLPVAVYLAVFVSGVDLTSVGLLRETPLEAAERRLAEAETDFDKEEAERLVRAVKTITTRLTELDPVTAPWIRVPAYRALREAVEGDDDAMALVNAGLKKAMHDARVGAKYSDAWEMCRHGSADNIRCALTIGWHGKFNVNRAEHSSGRHEDGYTPFQCAVQRGALDVIKTIVEDPEGFDENQCGAEGYADQGSVADASPFGVACYFNQHETVRYLATLPKTKINQVDRQNRSPFMLAVLGGHVEVARYLAYELKVKLDVPHNIVKPFLFAAVDKCGSSGVSDIVKFLVEDMPEGTIDIDGAWRGWSPISQACANRNIEMVRYLQSKGADINARDKKQRTCFWRACDSGALALVLYLAIEVPGVNVFAIDEDEISGLAVCRQRELRLEEEDRDSISHERRKRLSLAVHWISEGLKPVLAPDSVAPLWKRRFALKRMHDFLEAELHKMEATVAELLTDDTEQVVDAVDAALEAESKGDEESKKAAAGAQEEVAKKLAHGARTAWGTTAELKAMARREAEAARERQVAEVAKAAAEGAASRTPGKKFTGHLSKEFLRKRDLALAKVCVEELALALPGVRAAVERVNAEEDDGIARPDKDGSVAIGRHYR